MRARWLAVGLTGVVFSSAVALLFGWGDDRYVLEEASTPTMVELYQFDFPPPTEALLEIDGPATVDTLAIAVRDSPPPTTTTTTTVPEPTGVMGLPLAPEGLDACAEANFYRVQFGLPDRFSDQPRIPAVSFANQGYLIRESNCRNDVTSSTGCCVGYWQLHKVVFRDHRMLEGIANCGATWLNVQGNDPLSKQRQACAAAVLFAVAGYSPWRL